MNVFLADNLPKRISGLNELSHNLWWSWHQEARGLFKALDPRLWKATSHNPVKLLQQIAPHRLVAAADDLAFLKWYDSVIGSYRADMTAAQDWFHASYPHLGGQAIAYFSMEFAIHNSLPIYAGGLGVLAGDYCKEASDLGVPLIGVGFMYPQGYFHQHISDSGWQEEVYRQLNFSESPIARVLDGQKQPAKVAVELGTRSVCIAVWQVNVGRVKLYLLDSDIDDNCPEDRQLTARLYGGDREMRLRQEIILGIGGVRMLRALGVEPSVWHANEGHAAFMTLERCREMVESGVEFAEAVNRVQATTVFTTHTPVPAGNDTFPYPLVEKYLQRYWGSLECDRGAFLQLGTLESDSATFNMTVLGLRMANQRNGVSQLHGAVCRRMWHVLWPDCEEKEVPIGSVTNGVHMSTWMAPQLARLYTKYIDPDWLAKHDDPALWEHIDNIPDEEIWMVRLLLKNKLISAVQSRARQRWVESRGSPVSVLAMGALLDAEVLTIGFSRRFTDYKRAALILRDPNRLKRLLLDELRPVQIVFSGKAHPSDEHGKHLIQEVYNMACNPEFGGRIAFVEEYDIHMAHYLVPGVDVWLNTPRPLQEASGTSGMKAGLNGVAHLSVLDGWWCEGYNGTNGWAMGNNVYPMDPERQDREDAGELYHILEEKVVPLYYERDLNGIPRAWIRLVKQAIRSTAPLFSARRMVKEYTEQMYVPAAEAGKAAQLAARPTSSI